jgi:hypothetical protein
VKRWIVARRLCSLSSQSSSVSIVLNRRFLEAISLFGGTLDLIFIQITGYYKRLGILHIREQFITYQKNSVEGMCLNIPSFWSAFCGWIRTLFFRLNDIKSNIHNTLLIIFSVLRDIFRPNLEVGTLAVRRSNINNIVY